MPYLHNNSLTLEEWMTQGMPLPNSRITNGTEGRVYGGDPNLIHIADGTRYQVAERAAEVIGAEMRLRAHQEGQRTWNQIWGSERQSLCPGCYMVVGFDTMLLMARQNGQSLRELGLTMANAFAKLAEDQSPRTIEEILVILDSEPCPIEMRD